MKYAYFIGLILTCSVLAGTRSKDGLYGPDNRIEVNAATRSQKKLASSTVAMIKKEFLPTNSSGSYSLTTPSYMYLKVQLEYEFKTNVCSETRFSNQPVHSSCTGALIAPDLILTAGHCVNKSNSCSDFFWVFNYKYDDKGKLENFRDSSDIYSCKKIVSFQLDDTKGLDYAIVQLNRPAKDKEPLTVQTWQKIEDSTKLFTIGTPAGLPMKVTTDGRIRSNYHSNYFMTNLDTFHGNSGSPVFDEEFNVIEGILVRGDTDYTIDSTRKCVIEQKCTEYGCNGEAVSRVSSVPELKNFPELREIINEGTLEEFKLKMPENYWIDYSNRLGETLLLAAAASSNEDAVKMFQYLLEKKANINVKDGNENNLLHYWAQGPNQKIFDIAVKAGLKIDSMNKNGETPLLVAAQYQNLEAFKTLLKAGAKSNITSSWGQFAIQYFNDEEIQELRSLGAYDPDIAQTSKYHLTGKLFKAGTLPKLKQIKHKVLSGRCFYQDAQNIQEKSALIIRKSGNDTYEGYSPDDPRHQGSPDYYDHMSLDRFYEFFTTFEKIQATENSLVMKSDSQISVWVSEIRQNGDYLVREYRPPQGSGLKDVRCYYFLNDNYVQL